jgi:hypothetical protein
MGALTRGLDIRRVIIEFQSISEEDGRLEVSLNICLLEWLDLAAELVLNLKLVVRYLPQTLYTSAFKLRLMMMTFHALSWIICIASSGLSVPEQSVETLRLPDLIALRKSGSPLSSAFSVRSEKISWMSLKGLRCSFSPL